MSDELTREQVEIAVMQASNTGSIEPLKRILETDAALRAKVEAYKQGYDDQVALKDRHEAGFVETIAQLQAQLAAMTLERDRLKEAAESLPCIVCIGIMQAALRGEPGGG